MGWRGLSKHEMPVSKRTGASRGRDSGIMAIRQRWRSTRMSSEHASDRDGLSRLPSDSGEIEKYYDDWATDYDRTLAEWRYEAPTRAAEILRARLGPDAVILDAGCGTGLTGKALADAGFTTFDGIDLSSRSLEGAAEHGVYRALG